MAVGVFVPVETGVNVGREDVTAGDVGFLEEQAPTATTKIPRIINKSNFFPTFSLVNFQSPRV